MQTWTKSVHKANVLEWELSMNANLTRVLVCATLFALNSSPARADLFVSGDVNFLTTLGGAPLPLPNQVFLKNIAGGTNIVIQDILNFPQVTTSLSEFFLGAGYTVAVIGATEILDSTSLSGADLLIAAFPANAFVNSEIAVIGSFLNAGGNVLVTGDNFLFTTQNGFVNSLLSGLGSGMQILPDTPTVGGYMTAQLQGPSPYLSGTTGFQYGSASAVSGGTPLFGTAGDNVTFLAVEPVPEPATYLLMLGGLIAVSVIARRRGKC
jgi:PEP-CTERM motif